MPHCRNKGQHHCWVSQSWPYLTVSFTLPNSLRRLTARCLAWPRGKNLARFIGELLQALLQPLPPPFAALGYYFTFNLSQTRQSLLGLIHIMTLRPCLCFLKRWRRPLQPFYSKDSVKMRPSRSGGAGSSGLCGSRLHG